MRIILSKYYKRKFKYFIDFYKDKAEDIHYNKCTKSLIITSWKSSHWFQNKSHCHLLRKSIHYSINYNGIENVKHGLNQNEYFWSDNFLR